MEIVILGAGRVGSALAANLASAGHRILDIWNRSERNGATAVGPIPASVGRCSAVLLCVSDDAIAGLARQVAPLRRPNTLLAHCSGALPASILGQQPVASMHPLQTFAAGTAIDLATVPFVIEGDPRGLELTRELLDPVGSAVTTLKPGSKTLYHAAAVFGSNYALMLLEASRQLLQQAGVESLALLEPLWQQTFANAMTRGPRGALTGPLARGDLSTIARHRQALATSSPDLLELYDTLARGVARDLCDPAKLDPKQLEKTLSPKKK